LLCGLSSQYFGYCFYMPGQVNIFCFVDCQVSSPKAHEHFNGPWSIFE